MTALQPADSELGTNPLIVLFTSGTGGDINPFMRIQAGLHQRGFRTVLLAPTFHEKLVHGAGLPYQTFGTAEQFQAVLADPALWDERKGFGVVWRGLLPSIRVMQDFVAALPPEQSCVVLSHPFLAPIAALARSIRSDLHIVGAYLAPANLRSVYDPMTLGSLNVPKWVPLPWRRALWRFVDWGWIDPELLPGLNAARSAINLPPVAKHFLLHMQEVCDASVGLFPAWYAPSQPDWPTPYAAGKFPLLAVPVESTLPPTLERFLTAGDAPIVFTPGTGHQHARHFFETALAACRKLGRRGLFISANEEQIPKALPPEILWQPFAPFDVLLPRVAAIVHHGGVGTTAEALRAGVPQLVMPFAFDQFDNGIRVSALGVGQTLVATRLSTRRMCGKLRAILDGAVQSKARATASLFGRSEQADTEQLLESVVVALGVH